MSASSQLPVIVFDIGGTHFRSGSLISSDLVAPKKQPAINYRNTSHASCRELLDPLVDYLLREVRERKAALPQLEPRHVGISIGAPVDANSGVVLGSGPLWGPAGGPVDLKKRLSQHVPEFTWHVINDLTAALLRYVDAARADKLKRLSLITISTGIGLRTYDLERNVIPVDRRFGIQGEIGHIPITFAVEGATFDATCDCGGQDHLNAFCSGRGIETLLPILARRFPARFAKSSLYELAQSDPSRLALCHLVDAVHGGDPWAANILRTVTFPVAQAILHLFAVDSEAERLILTGGVVHAFGNHYYEALLSNLENAGLYLASDRDPALLRQRIVLGEADDLSGLIGAGLYVREREQTAGVLTRCNGSRFVQSQNDVSYRLLECPDLLTPGDSSFVDALNALHASPGRHFPVVVDATVDERYGHQIRSWLANGNVEPVVLSLNVSERGKRLTAVEDVMRWMRDQQILRRSQPVIAVGGGILLDIVGFAASIFRRGIPYIRVPTSLVGYVDAGIGAKTGVNFAGGKNAVGSYHPPLAVLLCKRFLQTLAQRHIRCGMAEILKMGFMRDSVLLQLLKEHGKQLIEDHFQSPGVSDQVLRRSVDAMLAELEPNLFERDLTRAVDFGHSFSPWLEMNGHGAVLHGEAVGIDMAISIEIACQRGFLTEDEACFAITLIRDLVGVGYPDGCHPDSLWHALEETANHRDGRQRFPLPRGLGANAFVDDITLQDIRAALSSVQARL